MSLIGIWVCEVYDSRFFFLWIFFGFWICVMFGDCWRVVEVVLRAGNTFSRIQSCSELSKFHQLTQAPRPRYRVLSTISASGDYALQTPTKHLQWH